MRMTETSRAANVGPEVGNVPSPGAATFFPTIEPPMASAGMIIQKRPTSMSAASVRFQNLVLPFRPANAEPLFPAPLEYAKRSSDSPCGPALLSDEEPYHTT